MDESQDRRDETAAEDEAAARYGRGEPPENEIPTSLGFDVVLVREDELVVFVSGLRVFSTGVQFTVEVRTQSSHRTDRRGITDALLDGGKDRLLLGVEFADGRRCSNLHRRGERRAADAPSLHFGSGGGGGRSARLSMFLAPLPPAGPLRLVCAWPEEGVGERSVLLPTDDILDAAERVVELWPWRPDIDQGRVPEAPTVPPGGWFADEMGSRAPG